MDVARPTADPGARAPRLLVLVFGIFLVLVGITASALVAITSYHLSDTTVKTIVDGDRSLIDRFANRSLEPADLTEPMGELRRATVAAELEALVDDELRAVEVHGANGPVVTSRRDADGVSSAKIEAALAGTAGAEVVGSVLLEYLPLMTGTSDVLGVVVVERDATRMLAALGAARRDVLIITLGAATVLAGILGLVFRAANQRLRRQQHQLAEAVRRDALTGMLNHGSVVAVLAEQAEAARRDGAPIAVALVDVDNFRLFNDTHGHAAGDEVLLRVAERVAAAAEAGGVAGRYGPDEFIVVRPGMDAAQLEELAAELQAAARAMAIRVDDSEELPVTVSIGIAAVPAHATSVTPLLSQASVALTEARASGGDAVVVARVGGERTGHAGSFDVLQGLVLAVDTKDRYTKRHSEDVARYAVYLARRMGLDDMLEPVRLAGLLHDVGKIGIPDGLLRKPSRLTEAEVKVFNQHVALGDAIVRDIPHLDDVRAGIRHHHERWDGGGYLGGLAGEAIPLIARIIAVADTFSAMTTTRPYRKALPIEEALRRLREAAGTQLQPELVETFAAGIETDPAAPMPNEASDVWLPLRVA